MRPRKFERRIITMARELGFQNIRFTRLRRHPLLCAEINGKQITYVFGGNKGDFRAEKNIAAELRRIRG